MTELRHLLAARVNHWRDSSYASDAHPTLAEILVYLDQAETGAARFPRQPQLRASEMHGCIA